MSTPKLPSACPIARTQAEIYQLLASLVRQVRAARRLMRCSPCAACEMDPDRCPARAEFDPVVNTAIQQIADEWNLGETLRDHDER